MEPYVLGGPALAEQLAAGGQLAHQRDEVLVAGVTAGLQPQHRGGVAGDLVVVDENRSAASGLRYTNRVVFRRPSRVGLEHG